MLKMIELEKAYGKNMVLYNINLELNNQEGIYGLLGRNGAGKTTMMRMLYNMIPTYRGRIELNGQNLKDNPEALSQLIYVGGDIYKNNHLFQGKINKLLKVYQQLFANFDLDFAKKMLADFHLDQKSKFSKLSTGNKTLIQNILGLASRSAITILDEPTNGLDSVNRQIFFRHLIEDHQQHPRMFILSTHLIQEIEPYLTDVIMLKDAKILMHQPLSEIQNKAYRVINYQLNNKNIIHQENLSGLETIDIYDDLSKDEIEQIHQAGGKVDSLGLQALFNYLMEG
ncbi:ATP-binding cassette domain-containing protein [Ignavigranum ruoffiae]|uniref:ABC-2 type transport system ATP-binding protein n=1 Tax=Ignavigranum ruoffiae TaxID=89093 RepID=A0A1H8YX30_9LACT|nr:ABC transporter ATP-binding protein [Ignavigranum ruoffiae]SEP56785.1 ABC-2 type transport system ATP-binding protein [Ignavigranum ruoffiae]